MAYDPRSIKLPKAIKRVAATELDAHKRGALIRSYVKILEDDRLQGKGRKSKEGKRV
jgi:hypothetical protein